MCYLIQGTRRGHQCSIDTFLFKFYFFRALPDEVGGDPIVITLSVHLSVCLSICLSVYPSHFCQLHISKSIKGNLMKLDTLIEGYKENCKMQEP